MRPRASPRDAVGITEGPLLCMKAKCSTNKGGLRRGRRRRMAPLGIVPQPHNQLSQTLSHLPVVHHIKDQTPHRQFHAPVLHRCGRQSKKLRLRFGVGHQIVPDVRLERQDCCSKPVRFEQAGRGTRECGTYGFGGEDVAVWRLLPAELFARQQRRRPSCPLRRLRHRLKIRLDRKSVVSLVCFD